MKKCCNKISPKEALQKKIHKDSPRVLGMYLEYVHQEVEW